MQVAAIQEVHGCGKEFFPVEDIATIAVQHRNSAIYLYLPVITVVTATIQEL